MMTHLRRTHVSPRLLTEASARKCLADFPSVFETDNSALLGLTDFPLSLLGMREGLAAEGAIFHPLALFLSALGGPSLLHPPNMFSSEMLSLLCFADSTPCFRTDMFASIPLAYLSARLISMSQSQPTTSHGRNVILGANHIEIILLTPNQHSRLSILQHRECECLLTILVKGILKVRIMMLSTTYLAQVQRPTPGKIYGTANVLLSIDLIRDLIDATNHQKLIVPLSSPPVKPPMVYEIQRCCRLWCR